MQAKNKQQTNIIPKITANNKTNNQPTNDKIINNHASTVQYVIC